MAPLQMTEKVSGSIRGSGEPAPQLKLMLGSLRVRTWAVKSMLLKYSPTRPAPAPPPPPPVLPAVIFIQLKLACPPGLGPASMARRSTCVPAERVPRLLVMVVNVLNEPVLGMVI